MIMDILQYNYFKISPRISYRYLAFIGFLRKKFTLSEFFNLLLPGSMKNNDVLARFQVFFKEYHDRGIRRFLNQDGSLTLFSHPFYTYSYEEAIIIIDQVVVRDQYHVKRFMKDGDVIIDAGANIGVFSAMVAHKFPHARVYAVEPTHETFGVLVKNMAAYSNVVCVESGLGNQEEKKELTRYDNHPGTARIDGSVLSEHDPKYGHIVSETASLTTIDALVAKQNIPRVDFIKMDTEGYEAKILTGAKDTIRRWKPVITMSAYHATEDKVELPKLLKSICPDYICELHREAEEDLVCYVK